LKEGTWFIKWGSHGIMDGSTPRVAAILRTC